MNYFKKLPTITYDGQLARNLLARAKLSEETKNQDLVFQDFAADATDRVDQLAFDYYNSPGYSWLVMFSNEIVDPYYDFTISDAEFDEFIANKYGSVDIAKRRIVKWRINWEATSSATPEQFAQFGTFKRYYRPVLNSDLQVARYEQNTEETEIETNIIVELTMENIQGEFQLEEEIRQSSSLYGFVAGPVLNNKVLVKNVVELGKQFSPGLIQGVQSGAFAEITAVKVLAEPIVSGELQLFWEPLSAYDMEFEANDKKRNIKLLDARYRDRAETELKRAMENR